MDEWLTEIADWFDQYKRHYELTTEKVKFTERKEKAFELRYHDLKTVKKIKCHSSRWLRKKSERRHKVSKNSLSSISEKFILGPALG